MNGLASCFVRVRYVLIVLCAWAVPVWSSGHERPLALTVALHDAGGHEYFPAVIKAALFAEGYDPEVKVVGRLPQKRIMAMFQSNALSLIWLVRSKARDARYTVVDFPLTGGLIGYRILLIPKGQQSVYDPVMTLDDFRRLNKVAVMGKNWFDASVWSANGLLFRERDGDWRQKVYAQVAQGDRGVDYFPRGALEILGEATKHPELDIEDKLLLIYDRDFVFYLSEKNSYLKPILESGLRTIEKQGLMAELRKQFWPDVFSRLHLDQRRKLRLKTPD